MPLHDLTALEQAAAIGRGDISASELLQHYLSRIDQLSDRVGAFVAVDRAPKYRDGQPLSGAPVGVKDLTFAAGLPIRFGTAALDAMVAEHDDYVVDRLRGAGMAVMGKTSTPEFGLTAYTEPDGAPPARTPWDLSRTAGGSSGGSAAAVATGLVPVAQGTDGAGSVRSPASCCGLVGLKASRGRISTGPAMPDGPGLATHGFLTRTVRDAAALLDAAAGPMPGDAIWLPPPGEPFLAMAGREPGRLRIGRHRVPLLADVELAPEVVSAYDACSALLVELGHDVEDVDPPFRREVTQDFELVWSVGVATIPLAPAATDRLTPLARWLRARGDAVSGAEYAAAVGRLQVAARSAVASTAAYDAVLVPTLAALPPKVGALRDDDDPATDFADQERFNPFSAAYNLTGQPAITLPLMWTEDGLPVGVQLVGRPAGEATLLALSAQLEEACPWVDRKPSVW